LRQRESKGSSSGEELLAIDDCQCHTLPELAMNRTEQNNAKARQIDAFAVLRDKIRVLITSGHDIIILYQVATMSSCGVELSWWRSSNGGRQGSKEANHPATCSQSVDGLFLSDVASVELEHCLQ
jgi:hypothetical protein